MAVLPSEVNINLQMEPVIAVDPSDPQLIRYLKEELAISDDSIEFALRHCEQERGTLPMVLWRYGFVSIAQLDQIFDWLAQ